MEPELVLEEQDEGRRRAEALSHRRSATAVHPELRGGELQRVGVRPRGGLVSKVIPWTLGPCTLTGPAPGTLVPAHRICA